MNKSIAVAGTGYVGLSISVLLAQHNHVVAVDIIPEKIALINQKKSPIQDEYIEKYFETYPKIKGFLDGLVEEGKEKGYVTTMFGRRRPIPELKSGNFMQRSFGERVAMNSPIQGTAADIIKIAMNRVYRRLKDENLKSRLVLQVHDELLIETCKEEIPQVSAILEEEMKGAAKLSVELEVDMHQGNNWYEAK